MSDLIRSHSDLALALGRAVEGHDTPYVLAEREASGSRINLLARAFRRYWNAHTKCKAWGFIGVGQISFAEARLAKFCEKVGLTIEG